MTPMKCQGVKEPQSPVQMCITDVSSSVTNTPVLLTLSQHQPLLYKKIPPGKKRPGDPRKGEGKKVIGQQSDLKKDESKL